VKISLFYELITPRPWKEETEFVGVQQALEQLELADQYDFHKVWAVEHHFLEEYAHLTAPEVFLAAVSQRTKRLRLGHGIMNILPEINHPLRAAERIATLDLLSDGRVEFGSGSGSSDGELNGFHVDPGTKRAAWRESLEVAVSALADTPFPGIDGEFLTLPPRNVIPKPRQKPHPPLWMACTRRETIRDAAELGLGALCFFFVEPEACREWVEEYYRVLEERCVPVGRFANPNIAMTTWTHCAQTTELAYERALTNIGFFRFASSHYYQHGTHYPGVTDVWELYERSEGYAAASETVERISNGSLAAPPSAVGDADHITAYLRRYEEAGVDEVLLGVQVGRIPHEHIMESLERIGRDVLPQFAERDQARMLTRADRLSEIVEAAQERRPDPEVADPSYAFSGAAPKAWQDGREVSGMKDALDNIYAVVRGEQREIRPEDVPEIETTRT
jgi:alkanesulfonate monooxygenase SsuD/methylene tetrahydromethanopterin reductase-like flavin-dependent oxidoreductase (luciferase family)